MKVVVVGGGGHVGLPLSIVLADSGIQTYAFDIAFDVVNSINKGFMPFMEEGAPEKLQEVLAKKRLIATTDVTCIAECDFVIIVVGTPVDEHLGPNPNSVISAILNLKEYLNSKQTVILRSTIFPGVTKKVFERLQLEMPGIKIAYCPERIIEGQALREIRTLPQIIGSYDKQSFQSAKAIFDRIGVESIHVQPEEAELAKLFTNVWRYIKFAAANQFWMMANDLNVDYEVVRTAISYNYPRASDLPRAGFAAGPCLFKDTMQLSALVQQNFPLGHSAMMVNEGTPGYLVRRLKERFDLANLTVGILGVAFKGNVDDTRSSLAFKLRKLLLFESKEVLISDPFVEDNRLTPMEEILEKSDVLIIGSPHFIYRDLVTEKPVIDIWGIRNQGVLI
jgi:UDP-N-acetyl-D-mannosaminuronic acid dehydrogenase